MLEVKVIDYDELCKTYPEYKHSVSNNGAGKELAGYLVILLDNKIITLESDAMEPEDVSFHRDLSWVKRAIEEAYRLGKLDALCAKKE